MGCAWEGCTYPQRLTATTGSLDWCQQHWELIVEDHIGSEAAKYRAIANAAASVRLG